MHRALFLLTCACAAHAQHSHPLPWHMLPSDISGPSAMLKVPPHQSSNLPLRDSSADLPDWMTDDDYSLDLIPIDNIDDASTPVPPVPAALLPPQVWVAKPYRQALQDVDKLIDHIRSHFTQDAFTGQDNRKFRFIVLLHAIDNLSKEVAINGWKSYDTNFPRLIRAAIQESLVDSAGAAHKIECAVLEPILAAIRPVRKVIENLAVDFTCKAQPQSCDAVIWAMVQTSPKDTLITAEKLLIVGKAARTYLNDFANTLDAVAGLNVYKYLLDAQEELRPLIGQNAHARKVINPSGEPSCANSSIDPRILLKPRSNL